METRRDTETSYSAESLVAFCKNIVGEEYVKAALGGRTSACGRELLNLVESVIAIHEERRKKRESTSLLRAQE